MTENIENETTPKRLVILAYIFAIGGTVSLPILYMLFGSQVLNGWSLIINNPTTATLSDMNFMTWLLVTTVLIALSALFALLGWVLIIQMHDTGKKHPILWSIVAICGGIAVIVGLNMFAGTLIGAIMFSIGGTALLMYFAMRIKDPTRGK